MYVLFIDLLVVADEKFGLEEQGENLNERVHLDLGQVGDVLDRVLGLLVEEEQDGHLERRGLERVAVLGEVRDDLAFGETPQPAQFAAVVLR